MRCLATSNRRARSASARRLPFPCASMIASGSVQEAQSVISLIRRSMALVDSPVFSLMGPTSRFHFREMWQERRPEPARTRQIGRMMSSKLGERNDLRGARR
jgi:hypothetical protein